MEPKYFIKSDVQLKPSISRTINDKRVLLKLLESWIPSDYNDVSCFHKISKTKLECTFEVWVFSLFSLLAGDFCVSQV